MFGMEWDVDLGMLLRRRIPCDLVPPTTVVTSRLPDPAERYVTALCPVVAGGGVSGYYDLVAGAPLIVA